jgi:hypothetical protein
VITTVFIVNEVFCVKQSIDMLLFLLLLSVLFYVELVND